MTVHAHLPDSKMSPQDSKECHVVPFYLFHLYNSALFEYVTVRKTVERLIRLFDGRRS